jgi:hypothetical protein
MFDPCLRLSSLPLPEEGPAGNEKRRENYLNIPSERERREKYGR